MGDWVSVIWSVVPMEFGESHKNLFDLKALKIELSDTR